MLKRALTTRFAIGSLLFIVSTMAMFVSCTKDPGTTDSSPAEPATIHRRRRKASAGVEPEI